MIQTPKHETLEDLISLIPELQNENLDKDQVWAELIKLAAEWGLKTEPESSKFLSDLLDEAIRRYFKSPEQQPTSIPPNIAELVEFYNKKKQEEKERLEKSIASQEGLEKYKSLVNRLKKVIATNTTKELPPKLVEQMAENAANKIIASLPVVAQSDYFPKEDEKQLEGKIEEALQNELKKVGEELKIAKTPDEEKTTKEDKKIIETEAIKIAATPQIIRSFQEATQKETIVPSQIPSLSKEVLAKLHQPPEEVSFLPFYTILHPKVATAFIEKAIHTLPAKFLSLAAEDASPEWRAMMQKGLFVEDIQASIKALKAMGVPENHPVLKKLSDKAARLQEQQKFTIQTKDGQIIYKDTLAARIFKHYFHFDKITGRQKIYDDNLKTNLPHLSPDLTWSQGGYAGFLRNSLNRFKFVINTYERFSKFATKGKYTSFLTPVRQFFSQKVTQPVIRWLAKTAAGKAAQQGVKKAAGWLATKLGVKLAVEAGVVAAGAATGPPGWVVAAITVGLDILKALGKKIFGFIRKIIQDPEKALMAIGAGILALVFIPMPFALIAILPLIIGGLGLMTFIAAPATLGVIGGGIGAFFTAIAAIPIAAPIALFVIILFSVLAGLTLFIVLVVSGSFILPGKVAEVTPTVISPYESPYFELKKAADPSRMDNIQPGNSVEITYKVTITAKDKKLTIGPINEEISLNTNGNPPKPQAHSFDKDLQKKGREINPGETWEAGYTINVDSSFNNTAIINTINVSLAVNDDEVAGAFPGTTSAVVVIGNPPIDCPSGWPIYPNESPTSVITQGPGGSFSHIDRITGKDKEAVDISAPAGTPVHATHFGTIVEANMGGDNGGNGNYITIKGTCEGKTFYSKYLHLKSIFVGVGNTVVFGQKIAESGNTGASKGPHLDYRFTDLLMQPRFIPKNVRKCDNCDIPI